MTPRTALTVTMTAALASLLTACAAHPSSTTAPARSTTTATATPTVTAQPSVSPSPAASTDPQITISGQAAHLSPGPFKITPIFCGKFTAAQRTTFGTTAQGGLIYRYTNESNSLTAAATLSVNFLNGSNVAGNNVAGAANLATVDPGQSAEGEVDAVGASAQGLTFTGCELMEYSILTGTAGALPGSYAP